MNQNWTTKNMIAILFSKCKQLLLLVNFMRELDLDQGWLLWFLF